MVTEPVASFIVEYSMNKQMIWSVILGPAFFRSVKHSVYKNWWGAT